MRKRADSTTLFLKQIGTHTEELARLLAIGSTEPIASDAAERTIRCTTMLTSSASLLELQTLTPFLQSYCDLLRVYIDRGLNWDERIAQLTSELIELEDQWFNEGEGKKASDLAAIFTGDQLAALSQEMDDVRSFAESARAQPVVEEPMIDPTGDDSAEQFVPLTSDRPEDVSPGPFVASVDPQAMEDTPAEPLDRPGTAHEDVWVETTASADKPAPDSPSGPFDEPGGFEDLSAPSADLEEWADLADKSAAVREAHNVDARADESEAPGEPQKVEVRAEAPATDVADTESFAGRMVSHGRMLDTSIGELRRITESFLDRWQSLRWDSNEQDTETLQHVRGDLFSIGFHAHSIERMIGVKMGDPLPPRLESLAPVMSALDDFGQLLCAGTERTIEVTFTGEDNRLDARLLAPAVKIIQGMIADIADRCVEEELRIDVVVEERRGVLRWMFRDNGRSSITDTSLDPDDYPVYYKSLRETYRALEDLHSVLWVEPTESHDARFAFNIPMTSDRETFVAWGDGDQAFAVLAAQVCDVVAVEDVDIERNDLGDHLNRDGHRIPLFRLGQLCDDARVDGGRIVIIGNVESRVAFYVDTDGEVAQGTWERDAIPAWRGVRQGIAQIGDSRATLLETSDLLDRYQKRVSNPTDERTPGSDTHRAASRGSDSEANATQPEPDARQGYVLIIERSEGLRSEFNSILATTSLRAKVVGDIDAAVESLSEETPALIISEFRVPSMAAKLLVERLRAEGLDIPVVVTTAHNGSNAETLVQKLGVTSYISKPLSAAEVLERIDSVLKGESAAATEA